MIQNLVIKNFKSIRDLSIDCKRVNVLIGEPNTGKSNLLEALALQALQLRLRFDDLVRANDLSNLFYENDLSNKIMVSTDSHKTEILYEQGSLLVRYFKDTKIEREFVGPLSISEFRGQGAPWDLQIHPYFFKKLSKFPELSYDFLSPPYGENLFLMLQTNKSLRNLVSDLVQDRGFKLTLRQATNEVEISKEENNILTTYPFTIVSDTLQRIIFFAAAIETNKNGSTLAFEEPESNIFPYYTKYLAEKIAMDSQKQYFISTHNPYFLQSVVEKTPAQDMLVCLVDMKDYQTVVNVLSEVGKEEILNLNSDVFLNFDKLLEQ